MDDCCLHKTPPLMAHSHPPPGYITTEIFLLFAQSPPLTSIKVLIVSTHILLVEDSDKIGRICSQKSNTSLERTIQYNKISILQPIRELILFHFETTVQHLNSTIKHVQRTCSIVMV